MTPDDLVKTLIPAVTALLGGMVGAGANYWFGRRKTAAEVEKLLADADKTRAETRRLLSEIASNVQEVSTKLGRTNEIVVYDGTAADGADFASKGDRFPGEGEDKPKGTGILTVANGVLNLERTNTAGRFRISLLSYTGNGPARDYLAKNELVANKRILKLTCDVKVSGGSHTLLFVLKKKDGGGEWLDSQERTFTKNEWIRVEVFFRIAPGDDCFFLIDDQRVARAPSSVQLRGPVLVERDSPGNGPPAGARQQ